MKPIKLYHGTSQEFERFDPAKTGNGPDQEGPGFYLTSDRNDAWKYATRPGPCHTILTVEFAPKGKVIGPRDKATLGEVRQLIKWAPDLDVTLTDWDENAFVAMTMVTVGAMRNQDKARAFQEVWGTCYSHHPASYLNSLVHLGYSAHTVRHSGGLVHYICYDAAELVIQHVESIECGAA